MDKNNEITNNDLAKMVANGFNEMGERIETLKQDIGTMKQDIGTMKQDIGLLNQGQERIEMRLNNVVYRSELDAVLDRVQILEKQMKVALKNG